MAGTKKKSGTRKTSKRKKEAPKKKFSWKDERLQKIFGIILIFFGVFLAVSLTSYLFTWKLDQDKVLQFSWKIFWQGDLTLANWGGRLGAILSHTLIYWGVGVSSYLLLPFLFKWGISKLNRKIPISLLGQFSYLAGIKSLPKCVL